MQASTLLAASAALLCGASAHAQTVLHYWNFSGQDDIVGGLVGTAVGTPDLSLHATYGEAYPGSGPSLNTILNATTAGGGFLSADCWNGSPTALAFGTNDFSISYWVYDEDEGDVRGPRVFDCIVGTSVGFQLGTDAANNHNFRIDGDNGGVVTTAALGIVLSKDVWHHVAINIDRTADTVDIYIDGVLTGTASIAGVTGNVEPTQDLEIGVLNGGDDGNGGDAQNSAVDDLAFFDALLSANDIAGLAAGTLTPLDFGGGGFALFCDPANNHTGGSYVTLANSGFSGPGVVHLEATDGPAGEFAYFLVSATVNDPGSTVSNGMLCLGAPTGRYAPAAGGTLNSIGQFDAAGVLQNLAGTSTSGSGYDVLATLPNPPGGTIMAGDTWYFQCWYRDGQRSNFSNVLEVTF